MIHYPDLHADTRPTLTFTLDIDPTLTFALCLPYPPPQHYLHPTQILTPTLLPLPPLNNTTKHPSSPHFPSPPLSPPFPLIPFPAPHFPSLLFLGVGVMRVQGWDVVDQQWEVARHGALGYVPQEGGLFEFLTVQVKP